MRTYYLHGKITPTGFHLKTSLLKKPPRGYYFIGEQIADSKYQSIRMIIENCSLHPPRGKEVSIGEVQTTFIKS